MQKKLFLHGFKQNSKIFLYNRISKEEFKKRLAEESFRKKSFGFWKLNFDNYLRFGN